LSAVLEGVARDSHALPVTPAALSDWDGASTGVDKQFGLKGRDMTRALSLALVLGTMSLSFVGCAKESSTTTESTVSTPEGETTVTEEVTVEQSGENPPPAN
jgi:hypothetical protein